MGEGWGLPKARKTTARLPGEVEWILASWKNLMNRGSSATVSTQVSRKVYTCATEGEGIMLWWKHSPQPRWSELFQDSLRTGGIFYWPPFMITIDFRKKNPIYVLHEALNPFQSHLQFFQPPVLSGSKITRKTGGSTSKISAELELPTPCECFSFNRWIHGRRLEILPLLD